MPPPKNFWRLNYTLPADLERMIEQCTVISPTSGIKSAKYDADDCIANRMKQGEGIFLGKLDEDTGRAVIAAIGIIQDQAPVTRVVWKRLSKTVLPNPQGGFAPWRERCFLFNGKRAEAYNFAADFSIYFPDQ